MKRIVLVIFFFNIFIFKNFFLKDTKKGTKSFFRKYWKELLIFHTVGSLAGAYRFSKYFCPLREEKDHKCPNLFFFGVFIPFIYDFFFWKEKIIQKGNKNGIDLIYSYNLYLTPFVPLYIRQEISNFLINNFEKNLKSN